MHEYYLFSLDFMTSILNKTHKCDNVKAYSHRAIARAGAGKGATSLTASLGMGHRPI